MHITRLRLLGFKSFVEPTELLVERGLTGVVGPNGCGKSNLLEALRWVMGESSHKSMRAAAMDDVIFAGTSARPARNTAEVTIFVDNSRRTAPAELNDSDSIEITRRIEREAGSAYRINGREARARDVKVLFEDAATGARSPALVRQGQIAEIVNAKPDQRRRILEDAAGIAGLHTRRHEAELRLRAAESNLARLGDILGQLNSQIDSLKRQARQAKRYKDVSGEIRRAEALLFHLAWVEAQAEVETREEELAGALTRLGFAVETESRAAREEADRAEALPPLREQEAVRGAALARLKTELESFEREQRRTEERRHELEGQIAQIAADLEREQQTAADAIDAIERLTAESADLDRAKAAAEADAREAACRADEASGVLATAERRLGELQAAAFEQMSRRRSLEASISERRVLAERLTRQLVQLETQTRDAAARAPAPATLEALRRAAQKLTADIATTDAALPSAEEAVRAAAAVAAQRRQEIEGLRIVRAGLVAEQDTIAGLLRPESEDASPALIDLIEVDPGYETALGAALGDDIEATLDGEAPVHWRHLPTDAVDPPLPAGVEPLASFVRAPAPLQRRLTQIGVVPGTHGALLQAQLSLGQRLVSLEGDLWRWDGFTATAEAPSAAAHRLACRNRLTMIGRDITDTEAKLSSAAVSEAQAVDALHAAETAYRSLRDGLRDAQGELARAQDEHALVERAMREAKARLEQLAEARGEVEEAQAEACAKVVEWEDELAQLPEGALPAPGIDEAQAQVAAARDMLTEARAKAAGIERERGLRQARTETVATDLERWRARATSADRQLQTLSSRIAAARQELHEHAANPEESARRREALLGSIGVAERERREAGDAVARAEADLKDATQALRAAQTAAGAEREARARTEAKLESARIRRSEESRKIRDALGVAPDGCLALAGLASDSELPTRAEVDRQLIRLKADRERLGGVNLQAETELQALVEQFTSMDRERADVEEAIAKLRSGIAQLNREGRRRLNEAFTRVNSHFQQLFTTLFGGGEARLELIEGDDPLESGLEIVAKPPGKKPATLSLLSGGEQTLTALSLIFAVFLTNPSPICVLDEVDAPLDDANVDRFCTLMEKMAADTETRFLVITHHPMTMTRMDRLFGVTMAEKGVSQLVSVDLAAAERFLEAG